MLVLTGDDDPLTPVANAKLIAHLLPDARLRVVPGEGHLMPLDELSPTPGLIREFLVAPDLAEAPVWTQGEVVDAEGVKAALAGKGIQFQPMPWGAVGSLLRHRAISRVPEER